MPDSPNPSSLSAAVDPLYLVTDEPIRHYKHDLLNLHPYADVIAGAALGTRGPFTIGIYGEWGQGKTSLLYHAKTLLEQRDPAEPKQFRYPHVIPALFNAWRYEREEHPIIPLVATIERALDERLDEIERNQPIYRTLLDKGYDAVVG